MFVRYAQGSQIDSAQRVLNSSQLIRADFNNFDTANFDAQAQAFQQIAKRFPVHKINCGCSIPNRLALGIRREAPSRNNQSFVRPPDHRTSKVANDRRGNGILPALALKQHMERHEIHAENTGAINPAVAGATLNFHFCEATLRENALAQALEAVRSHRL